MTVERIMLGKDIYLNLIETDLFKTGHAGVNFFAPLGSEAAMNALLFKVLKRGSKNYPTMRDINCALDTLYSAKISSKIMKIGECQVFGLTARFLDNKYVPDGEDIFSGVSAILHDILRNPVTDGESFYADYIAGEKVNLKDEIDAQINNKNTYAIRRCHEIMCVGEAYAFNELGSIPEIEAIDGQKLYAHYKSVLSTCAIEVYYIGRMSIGREKIIEKFSAMFAGIERGSIRAVGTDVIRNTEYKGETIEEMPVNQGKLSLGFRSGTALTDAGYAEFVLFNEIYGASPSSKLFEHVRERLSLCYYCRSLPDAHKGLLVVACGIENDKLETARDEILAQLEAVKKGDFTESEIANAKAGLKNDYKAIYDSAVSLEMWYIGRRLAGSDKSPDQAAADVLAVDAEGIKKAAQKVTLDTLYFLKGTAAEEGEQDE